MISLNLEKGFSLNLNKEFGVLKNINVGLGWDTRMDLDSIAILLDKEGKRLSTIYFSHKKENGIWLNHDNLTGEDYEEAHGDDEVISVRPQDLDKEVARICLFANIYSAGGRTFNSVNGAFIRLVNSDTDQELVRYDLKESSRNYNAFHFADLIIENNELSFEVIAEGLNGSVTEIERRFEKTNSQKKKKGFFGFFG